jgi:hypothetical protein
MTWRYRLFWIFFGLAFGLLIPVQIAREHFNTPDGVPLLYWTIGGFLAGLGWFLCIKFLLFSRAIDINAGSIEFVRRRGWLESRESVPLRQVSNAIVEKVTRQRDNEAGSGPTNRIECWLLKILFEDGHSRILCETTERSVVEELCSYICGSCSKRKTLATLWQLP